jgi:hypothetical protein
MFGSSRVPLLKELNAQYDNTSTPLAHRIHSIIQDFIQNPTSSSLSAHPLVSHVLLKNILHKNLVLRFRTGAVREFLTLKYGNYQAIVDLQECPFTLTTELLSSTIRSRVWYDIQVRQYNPGLN